jgi:hypothetical protein
MQCAYFPILATTADTAVRIIAAATFAQIDISGGTLRRPSMITHDRTAQMRATAQSQPERRRGRALSDSSSFSSVNSMSAISFGWSVAAARLEAGR